MRGRVIKLLASVTIMVVAATGLLIWGMYPVIQGDITAAFANDLAAFVAEHDGQLPSGWSEFCAWMKTKKHSTRWKETELAKRFRLLNPPAQEGTQSIPIYVKILDPSLLKPEDLINKRVTSAHIGSEMEPNDKSGAMR